MIYLNDFYIAHSILLLNVVDYICASSQQNVKGGSSSSCTATSSPTDVQLWTTKARHFYWGQKARRNGPIFVGSSSALKKELIAHFSVFLANCLWHRQNSGAQNGKY